MAMGRMGRREKEEDEEKEREKEEDQKSVRIVCLQNRPDVLTRNCPLGKREIDMKRVIWMDI